MANLPPLPSEPPIGSLSPLWLLGLASFTSMASMRACDSLLPQLARAFDTSTGMAAHTISAFAIAYGVLQIAFGPLGDRLGRTPVIAWAALACALGNLAIAFAPSLSSAVAWRAWVGAASGGIIPLSIAFIGDTVAYDKRQITLARLSLATILGMIAGQWLGGMAAEAWGWRSVFFGLAGLFGMVLVPLFRLANQHRVLSREHVPNGHFLRQMGHVLNAPWARLVLGTTALEGLFAFAAFAFVPSHLQHEFGMSAGMAGGVMALYGVGGLSFALFSAWLVPRLGERGLVMGGGTALGLAMAGLALAPHWHWVVPACGLGGLGLYMLHSTLQTHATQMAPQMRGTAISLFVVVLFGGQSLGVGLAALVVDHGGARWVFAATAVVMPALAWYFQRELARRPQGPAKAGAAG
jgi:MFS transporter, YNFM family, putative membrane transport protein